MKSKTMILIAGAVGVGYLLWKRRSDTPATQATVLSDDQPTTIIQNFYESDDDDEYPYGWGPTWAGYAPGLLSGGRRQGGRGHGHGGHGRHRGHGGRH